MVPVPVCRDLALVGRVCRKNASMHGHAWMHVWMCAWTEAEICIYICIHIRIYNNIYTISIINVCPKRLYNLLPSSLTQIPRCACDFSTDALSNICSVSTSLAHVLFSKWWKGCGIFPNKITSRVGPFVWNFLSKQVSLPNDLCSSIQYISL